MGDSFDSRFQRMKKDVNEWKVEQVQNAEDVKHAAKSVYAKFNEGLGEFNDKAKAIPPERTTSFLKRGNEVANTVNGAYSEVMKNTPQKVMEKKRSLGALTADVNTRLAHLGATI